MSCESMCLNLNKLCFKCYDEQYLKLPKEKKIKKNVFDKKTAASKDSWKDLEQQVANGMNKIPTIKEARRSRASGAK